jgi:hypothetical protein
VALFDPLYPHGKSEGEYCTFGVKEKQDVQTWVDLLKQLKD